MNEKLNKLIADYKKIDESSITNDMNFLTDLSFTSVELLSLVDYIEKAG